MRSKWLKISEMTSTPFVLRCKSLKHMEKSSVFYFLSCGIYCAFQTQKNLRVCVSVRVHVSEYATVIFIFCVLVIKNKVSVKTKHVLDQPVIVICLTRCHLLANDCELWDLVIKKKIHWNCGMFPKVESLDRWTLQRKGGQRGCSSPGLLPPSPVPFLLAPFWTTPTCSLRDVVVGISQYCDPTR